MLKWTGMALLAAAAAFGAGAVRAADAPKTAKCIVAGREVKVDAASRFVVVNGEKQYFCCGNCEKAFAADPEKHIKSAGKCPVNKNDDAIVAKASRVQVNNGLYYFCCPGCDGQLKSNPAKFVGVIVDPVTKKEFKPGASSPSSKHGAVTYLFENAASKAKFDAAPVQYVVVYK